MEVMKSRPTAGRCWILERDPPSGSGPPLSARQPGNAEVWARLASDQRPLACGALGRGWARRADCPRLPRKPRVRRECRWRDDAVGASRSGSIRPALPSLGAIVSPVVRELDLTIVYEPGEDGWIIASIPEVAGVFSQGQTREEARENVLEALKLMLSPEPRADDDRREREPLHLTIAA
jgi:predicted RNase H-like HicB family nuclease